MTTEAELLEETGGDLRHALKLACMEIDWLCRHVSAGLVRANTSRLKWTPKPPLDVTATSDEWIGTKERPE